MTVVTRPRYLASPLRGAPSRRARAPLASLAAAAIFAAVSPLACDGSGGGVLGCGPLVSEYGLAPGWGDLPGPLRQLPSGGTLCGTASSDATTLEQTVVLTSISASGLVAFYDPILAEAGCTLDRGTLVFTCANPDAGAGATGIGQLHLFVTGAAPTGGTPPGQAGASQVEPFLEIDYQP